MQKTDLFCFAWGPIDSKFSDDDLRTSKFSENLMLEDLSRESRTQDLGRAKGQEHRVYAQVTQHDLAAPSMLVSWKSLR